MSFVDRVEVSIKAGDGGDGTASFRHDKFKALGGPDGGNGGDGGNIILQASRNQNTLADFRYKKQLSADSGKRGGKAKKHGKQGADSIISVPIGTIVYNSQGDVLADFTSDSQQKIIAKGGKGGFGNAHFVSSTRQAPRVAEKGEPGEQLSAVFELKMIADVGLVGLPNAGKSTLLSVISNARPEIADYPFTTLTPNLGVVDVDSKTSLLFADIPGLIEGASEGKGLGDEFLRHVERTSVLVHLIDSYSQNVVVDYKTIMAELAAYETDLSGRLQVVVLTKIDGQNTDDLNKKIQKIKKVVPTDTQVLSISSLSGEGLPQLLRDVKELVANSKKSLEAKNQKTEVPVITVNENDDNEWRVEKAKDTYLISGRKIERFAHRTHFGDYHGEQRLRDILRKMGIMTELERLGIEPDQKIIIGQPPIGQITY